MADRPSNIKRNLPAELNAFMDASPHPAFAADYLGTEYQGWYSACKCQERERLRRIIPTSEYELYLRTV